MQIISSPRRTRFSGLVRERGDEARTGEEAVLQHAHGHECGERGGTARLEAFNESVRICGRPRSDAG